MSSMTPQENEALNKQWELSLYELQRTPQEAITDHTEIAISPRSLRSELICPICFNILKQTMTTKKCLHRFCADCIKTALKSGNKECPSCRKKVISKRDLRPDPNFDLLISKIYPNRDEFEEIQDQMVETIANSSTQAAVLKNINKGMEDQAQKTQDIAVHEPEPVEIEVELIFKPHPTEMLGNPLMSTLQPSRPAKTQDSATVDHLNKYLATRFTIDNMDSDSPENLGLMNFCLYIAASPGNLVVLTGSLTLRQVIEKYWKKKKNKPLVLYYSMKKT